MVVNVLERLLSHPCHLPPKHKLLPVEEVNTRRTWKSCVRQPKSKRFAVLVGGLWKTWSTSPLPTLPTILIFSILTVPYSLVHSQALCTLMPVRCSQKCRTRLCSHWRDYSSTSGVDLPQGYPHSLGNSRLTSPNSLGETGFVDQGKPNNNQVPYWTGPGRQGWYRRRKEHNVREVDHLDEEKRSQGPQVAGWDGDMVSSTGLSTTGWSHKNQVHQWRSPG